MISNFQNLKLYTHFKKTINFLVVNMFRHIRNMFTVEKIIVFLKRVLTLVPLRKYRKLYISLLKYDIERFMFPLTNICTQYS